MPSETPPGAGRIRVRDVARTLLALGAILPGLAAGLVVLAATRDRRRALDRAIQLWGDLGTAAAGIRLDVEGAEHLALRPAVFLLNHRSGIDPILICALLRHNFVGVAKREIARHPLLGPAFAFADVVFVDRADREQAIRALTPAVATLRRGTAIAIAPEGTRAPPGGLGRFRKGAFRIALAARVPIVPICVCNAEDVLPRGGRVMRAATVRVRVHPPVATDEWTREDLDSRIAAIEELYRRTLQEGNAATRTSEPEARAGPRSARSPAPGQAPRAAETRGREQDP